jgi:hypothetical protein
MLGVTNQKLRYRGPVLRFRTAVFFAKYLTAYEQGSADNSIRDDAIIRDELCQLISGYDAGKLLNITQEVSHNLR